MGQGYWSKERVWNKISVKSGDAGDVTILANGYNGTPQPSLTYTDSPTAPYGSKIAVELHSTDLHVGVRLTIENDLGQKDTLIIPAFLNTQVF